MQDLTKNNLNLSQYIIFGNNWKNSSVLDHGTLWINYADKIAPSISTGGGAINLGTFMSGTTNKFKGNGACGFSSTVKNFLNVCVYLNISDTLANHVVTTEWYKPKFTLGGNNLMNYLVNISAFINDSLPFNITYYTDFSYVRHNDIYKYVENTKTDIILDTDTKFNNVYNLINNIEGGTGGGGSKVASKWQGKKVTFFGDSITSQAQSYSYGFINKLNEEKIFKSVVNMGVPSSTII